MKKWITDYIAAHKAALDSVPAEAVASMIETLRQAHAEDRHIFIFGNGGSAANSSHFVTDLGKGASDKLAKRFRIMALNDCISWITAIGNDYAYEDIFVRQLENFAKPGDVVMSLSVSGNSPNCVKALDYAHKQGCKTIALVGAKRGRMADIADQVIAVADTHYGRVEDVQMTICHLLCYAFMERPELAAR